MDKNTLVTRIAAIVTTLAEINGSPESMLYIFCNMNMSEYETIRDILRNAGLVKIAGNYVTLTDKGKRTANELNTVIRRES